MKKLFIAFLSLITFFSLGTHIVQSQESEFDYNRAYADYVYNLDLYQKAHAEYIVARSAYLNSQTLAAQQKAQGATAEMLIKRDEAVKTYLTALRMKLKETEGVEATSQETLYSLIDAEVGWFVDHRDSISSAASLEDLQKDSQEARSRYATTELVIFKTLNAVSSGKVNHFQERIGEIVAEIKTKLSEIRLNGDKNVEPQDRWVLEVENRVTRSQTKEDEALALIEKIKSSERDKLSVYNNSQTRLAESAQYLKEATSFLKQIIVGIKTQDE